MKRKKLFKEIPTYTVELKDPEDGVYCVSFVDEPAIQSYWLAMSETESEPLMLSLQEDQQIVLGPVLIPNKKIYRKDTNGNPFYIEFNEETITKLRDKFHKNQFTNVTNEQHSSPLDGNYAVDSYILSDELKDERFKDLPNGTWMLSYKVEDKNFWDTKIKTGLVRGFSIEAVADLSLALSKVEEPKTELDLNLLTIETATNIDELPENRSVEGLSPEELMIDNAVEVVIESQPTYDIVMPIEETIVEQVVEPTSEITNEYFNEGISVESVEENSIEVLEEVTITDNPEETISMEVPAEPNQIDVLTNTINQLTDRISILEALVYDLKKTEQKEELMEEIEDKVEDLVETLTEPNLMLRYTPKSDKPQGRKGDAASSIYYYLNKK